MPEDTEILVSVDGEFTGPIPGTYSMISLGAVAYTYSGERISDFKVNIAELRGSVRHPVRVDWWSKIPEAWEAATKDPLTPKAAMQQFEKWLLALPGRPKLMGWPLPVDFMFVYWYYERFIGKPPFGYDGVDIKTFAMVVLGEESLSQTSRTRTRQKLGIPASEFSHDPREDAAEQAEIFFKLREMNSKR